MIPKWILETRCSKGPLIIFKQLKQMGNASIIHMPSLQIAGDLYVRIKIFQSFK